MTVQKKTVVIGQIATSFGLEWFESHRCSFCGLAMELDDRGFPPEDIRQIILAQDGEYQLTADDLVANDKNQKIIAVKVIRQALRLSMSEAKKLLSHFPNLAKGTEVEMQWLQMLLLGEGVRSHVTEICSKKNC